jgi:hypothetical protein
MFLLSQGKNRYYLNLENIKIVIIIIPILAECNVLLQANLFILLLITYSLTLRSIKIYAISRNNN